MALPVPHSMGAEVPVQNTERSGGIRGSEVNTGAFGKVGVRCCEIECAA